ncbi:TPA: fimbrial protein [Salmonella enterica subsp. enterica serovar Kintambo]|nr:fimbrial protein [Salmonella enterica subsp. enterica serovar Kintambo]EIJ8715634.1 fimbrial protein [Salmonella enterica]HCI4751690.1 fimbrial protein [Salmonella enterica subsp. enterica serovar Kintambo]
MKYRTFFYSLSGLAMLLHASLATAGVLDGGEVRFTGYVTDESPKWTWQIASTDQRWTVDTADAQRSGDSLLFDLRDRGHLPFLEGHLYKIADRGGPGFSPRISFSSNGAPFTLTQGGSLTDQRFRASVPVTDPENGQVVGALSFTLEQGLGISLGAQQDGGPRVSGMSLAGGDSVTQPRPQALSRGLMARLSALVLMNRGAGSGMSAVSNGQTLDQAVLSGGNVMNIAAAYASSLSDFELQLPASGTPAHWRARLAVTVTVQ